MSVLLLLRSEMTVLSKQLWKSTERIVRKMSVLVVMMLHGVDSLGTVHVGNVGEHFHGYTSYWHFIHLLAST